MPNPDSPRRASRPDLFLDLFGGVGADHELQPHFADFVVQFGGARAEGRGQVGPGWRPPPGIWRCRRMAFH